MAAEITAREILDIAMGTQELDAEILRLQTALHQIVVCESPYKMDRLAHAHEAIAYMQGLARETLLDTPAEGAVVPFDPGAPAGKED